MAKTLSKTITFFIGVISMFLAGVIYLIMSDLSFRNTSVWLIVATLLSFGGAISFFFSNNYVEKPKILYVLKGIGLALSIGFIIFLHCFHNGSYFAKIISDLVDKGVDGEGGLAASQATMIISYVLAYIGLAGQAANVVLTAVINDDDDIIKNNRKSAENQDEQSEGVDDEQQGELAQKDAEAQPAENK